MGQILKDAFHVYSKNFYLIAAVVLTIYVPKELILNLFSSGNWFVRLFFAFIVGVLLAPLSYLPTVHILHQWKLGNRTDYAEAMSAGIRDWRFALWTLFITHLRVLGGFFLLVVPGIILTLRYSLVPMAIYVERKQYPEARDRSLTLTDGIRGEIFLICIVIIVMTVPIWYLAYSPKGMSTISLIASCAAMVIFSFINAVLFEFYWQARLRRGEIDPLAATTDHVHTEE